MFFWFVCRVFQQTSVMLMLFRACIIPTDTKIAIIKNDYIQCTRNHQMEKPPIVRNSVNQQSGRYQYH